MCCKMLTSISIFPVQKNWSYQVMRSKHQRPEQFTPDNSADPRLLKSHANTNQNRFPLDFLHTFTIILPSVTWTLDSRSKFCFRSDHFYINLPSITRAMLWAPEKSNKEVHCSPKHWIYFKNPSTYSLSVVFGQSRLNTVSSTEYLSSFEVCMLLEFIPHPFLYSFGYLLRTPANSNYLRFPLKIRVIGSRLYSYYIHILKQLDKRVPIFTFNSLKQDVII